MRIIIIEKKALLRGALSSLLSETLDDVEIVGVSGFGSELGDHLERSPIDLIILGPGGADSTGYQDLANRGGEDRDIPVLIITEQASLERVLSARRLGARALVPVTSTPDLLRQVICLIGSGGSYFPLPQEEAPRALSDTESAIGDVQLTRRQREVLELLTEGQSNKEIARALGIFEGTVKAHLRAVMQKLNARNRTHLALVASRHYNTLAS